MNRTPGQQIASTTSHWRMENSRILEDAYSKVVTRLNATPFGEVGFIVTVHDGHILRVKHLHDETFKASPAGAHIENHAGI